MFILVSLLYDKFHLGRTNGQKIQIGEVGEFAEILYRLLAVYKNWGFAIYLQNNKTNHFEVWCTLNGYLLHN